MLAMAQGLAPDCGYPNPPCDWNDFENILQGVLRFIVQDIATPLAVLALVAGAIILLTSAGNPNRAGLGKKILYGAIIGLLLAWCTDIIINFILKAIGSDQTVSF